MQFEMLIFSHKIDFEMSTNKARVFVSEAGSIG